MSRSSLGRAVFFLALASGAPGCGGECAQSADVLLSLDGANDPMGRVKKLAVGVTVDGGTRGAYLLDLVTALSPGRSVLLSPASSITTPEYAIAIDVTAISDDGTPLLFGKLPAQTVGTHACNQLKLTLAVVGGDIDAGVPIDSAMPPEDLAGADFSMPPEGTDLSISPDLAPCTATTPDEDGDGRGDVCDVCAANANPTIIDGDSDGVPDVCDPAPAMAGNKAVYFQPFNSTPPGWAGTFTVNSGSAQVSVTVGNFSDVTQVASDPAAALPPGVMMQTYVTPTAITADIDAGLRVFLWTTVGSAGYRCSANVQSVGNPVLIISELGGGGTSADLGPSGNLTLNQSARIRIWQHGTEIGCEMARANGTNPVTVKRTIATAPAGPLRPGVGVGGPYYSNSGGVTAKYSSVFAVSYP